MSSDQACHAEVVKEIWVGREEVRVSHLQFADSTLLHLEGNITNISNEMKIVDCFCAISGLTINKDKTQISGIKINQEEILSIASKLGYSLDLVE